ncbi:hypothetical protein AB2N08_10735 [Massilia aurea]|uniref:hypothetical protein n=1 Tax=Massilia aurea TaxID=373040 RepID=UPI003461B261
MPSPTFTFLNHASFLVRTDSALLLVDPWLEGTVHNDACSLLDGATGSARLIAELNASGLPVFVWCSSARPDRLSRQFLQRFRAQFRGIATFLYRQGHDWRLIGELRRHRLAIAECPAGQLRTLARDLRLTAYASGEGESYCLIACGRRTLLHLGERALATGPACRSAAAQLRAAHQRVDVLLTGFATLAWCGNPADAARREAAAERGIERMALQAEAFRPRLIVPVASFARFSRVDNAWLNHGRRTPLGVLAAPRLAAQRGIIRFLRPGAQIDLAFDTLATLGAQHEDALAYWMALWRERPEPLRLPAQAALAELKEAFGSYRARANTRLHALPRLLELLGVLRPLLLSLPDLRQTVELSYRRGLRQLARDAQADITMCSGTALYLLRAEDGFDTTLAGGCFWAMRERGLSTFGRFFLPQRMGRRGLDRQRPWAMGAALLRAALARARRGMHAAER